MMHIHTRYDTIEEFNVDWKAEYSALSSTRSLAFIVIGRRRFPTCWREALVYRHCEPDAMYSA